MNSKKKNNNLTKYNEMKCSPEKILNVEKNIHKILSNSTSKLNETTIKQLNSIVKSFCKDPDSLMCNSILLLIIEKIFIFHKDEINKNKTIIKKITQNITINESILKINKFGRNITKEKQNQNNNDKNNHKNNSEEKDKLKEKVKNKKEEEQEKKNYLNSKPVIK